MSEEKTKTKWEEWQESQIKREFNLNRTEYNLIDLEERDKYQAQMLGLDSFVTINGRYHF